MPLAQLTKVGYFNKSSVEAWQGDIKTIDDGVWAGWDASTKAVWTLLAEDVESVSSFGDLEGVDLTGAEEDQVLTFDGADWVPAAPASTGATVGSGLPVLTAGVLGSVALPATYGIDKPLVAYKFTPDADMTVASIDLKSQNSGPDPGSFRVGLATLFAAVDAITPNTIPWLDADGSDAYGTIPSVGAMAVSGSYTNVPLPAEVVLTAGTPYFLVIARTTGLGSLWNVPGVYGNASIVATGLTRGGAGTTVASSDGLTFDTDGWASGYVTDFKLNGNAPPMPAQGTFAVRTSDNTLHVLIDDEWHEVTTS